MSRPLRKHNGVWVHSFFCIDPLEIDPSLHKEHSRKFIRLFLFSKLINLTHPVLVLHFRISKKMSLVFLPNYYCGKNWIFYRHVFFHEIFLSRIKIRPFFDLLTKYSGVKNQPQLFSSSTYNGRSTMGGVHKLRWQDELLNVNDMQIFPYNTGA